MNLRNLPVSMRLVLIALFCVATLACGQDMQLSPPNNGGVVGTNDSSSKDLPANQVYCEAEGRSWVVDQSATYRPVGGSPKGATYYYCVVPCKSDADCSGTGRPYCRTLGLYNGGDFLCNDSISICRTVDRDDCPG